MLEKCVLNSYLILLFSRKIPTFSYFLMKIPTFSYFFDLSYYLTPCYHLLCKRHRLQRIFKLSPIHASVFYHIR